MKPTLSASHPLEQIWSLLREGDLARVAGLLDHDCSWDDPLHDGASGDAVRRTAIPRLAAWYQGRAGDRVQHLRTTADQRRIVVEHVLALRDGLVWNQALRRCERAAHFELATAVVADRAGGPLESFHSLRLYFGTWSVLDGTPRVRVGPVAPEERDATRQAMDSVPTVRTYFDRLTTGDPAIIDMFEPDGYFREPASNYACGRDQLAAHFQHILELGGVGIDFLTATRQDERIGLEIQTVQWGTRRMDQPQAGFASYELGPHGLLQGARVYDSVVPPL